jgi:hypothetical protein
MPAIEGDLHAVAERTRYCFWPSASKHRAVDGDWLP